jgi:hypothetical protein
MTAFKTSVLFLIQRRLELALQVLAAIRTAKPSQLLIAADGPEEDARCRETREWVLKGIDWPCEVHTRFSPIHLGCRAAVSQALDWGFSISEHLIVIEDDCLPSASFFMFCEELLNRYHDTPEVMQICGANLSGHSSADGNDYYPSRFPTIWGWASWRRAWDCHDAKLQNWPEQRQLIEWQRSCRFKGEAKWRRHLYDAAYNNKVDAWSTAWMFSQQMNGGLSLIPSRNLVSNLGCGKDAVHTHDVNDPRAAMEAESLTFPLKHPRFLRIDDLADQSYFEKYCQEPTLLRRCFTKLHKLVARHFS